MLNMNVFDRLFGKNLSKIMDSKGVTVESLSGLTYLPQRMLAECIRGTHRIDVYSLYMIAVALDCKPTELLTFEIDEFEAAGHTEYNCERMRKICTKYNVEPSELVDIVGVPEFNAPEVFDAIERLLDMSGKKED